MAEFHTPMEEAPAAFPPTAHEQPTSTVPSATKATQHSADPIRSTTTEAMVPESRPEAAITAADEPAVTGKHTDLVLPHPQEKNLGTEEAIVLGEPASEGVLGYKAPGLVKSFRFSKKFFWFGDEAVAATDLHQYLRGEKPEVAHHNAAWSSQTGKGLLYFAKSESHKAQPAGIINLADISEVTKEGINDFHFKLHGQKHTFQAGSLSERDSWLVAVQKRAAESKTTTESITGSAGYKENFGKLGGPSAALAPIAPTTAPTTDSTSPTKTADNSAVIMPKKDTTVPKTTASPVEERTTKRKQKSRSASRKRGSIFGSLLGKKEEHDETNELKKEEKAEDKAERREEKKLEKEEKKIEKDEKKIEREEKHLDKPASKEVAHNGLSHGEVAPLDAAAIAARVIDAPVIGANESKPLVADQPTKPITTEPAVSAGNVTSARETTVETAPKPTKRNSLFGGLFQKKDVASPAEEKSERDIAPAVPAKDVPTKETQNHTTETPPVIAPMANSISPTTGNPASTETPATTTEPVSPVTNKLDTKDILAPTSETTVTAASPEPLKEKRRSSFFSNLGSKRERKVESDTGLVDSQPGQRSASPLPKLGGIFRNPSRAMRGNKDSGKKEPVSPATAKAINQSPETETKASEAPAEATAESSQSPVITEHAHGANGTVAGSHGEINPESQSIAKSHESIPSVQAAA
ncbi:MAG: hypothetical protein M1812_001790 [Candelaria pacifica]|nr:MAG: hypothetical protein M1812_001790 [Candelaria pacifica]